MKFTATTYDKGKKISECKVDADIDTNTWTISSWYTSDEYKHKGYGTVTLKKCLFEMNKKLGLPLKIEYIWNGANEYVLKWLNEHFGAISKCPIAVQKYQSDDDWDSHIYVLNRDKFIKYFDLKEG